MEVEGGGKSVEERLRYHLDAMARLAAEVVVRRTGQLSPPMDHLPTELVLHLRDRDQAEGVERVLEHWLRQADQAQEARDAFRSGHVYCFWCESPVCEHSSPSEPMHVFDGYEPTGRPRWVDFAALCYELKDERSDRVLSGSDEIVALYTPGSRLKAAQIPEFGGESEIYDVIGQVNAGYFKNRTGDRDLAVSIQVVGSKRGDGLVHLTLHVIATSDLFDVTGGTHDADLQRMIFAARQRLHAAERTLHRSVRRGRQRGSRTMGSEVERVLRDLVRDIDHHYRTHGRRTKHARKRSDDRGRPTETAFPEARRAHVSDVLRDVVSDAFVVLGKRGRIHVFREDGKHVTSVRMGGDEIRRRCSTKRWIRLPEERVLAFRERLRVMDGRNGVVE